MQPEPDFHPLALLEALNAAEVDYVVVDRVAGALHGSAYGTDKLDVAYSGDPGNLDRLAAALTALGARRRGGNHDDDLSSLVDEKTLAAEMNFTFSTPYGTLDVRGARDGAPPYAQLREQATPFEVGGRTVRAASLDHLIAMKEAAGRPEDRVVAMEYRQLSDELRAP